MKKHELALEKAEKYYSRLKAGKNLERKIGVSISEYGSRSAKSSGKHLKLTLYEPQIDIDAVDIIIRVETATLVQLMEIQIKTARNGLQISESMLRMADAYTKRGDAFVIICCQDPENYSNIDHTRCLHSWDVRELIREGMHVSAAQIEECPSYDLVLMTMIEAMT